LGLIIERNGPERKLKMEQTIKVPEYLEQHRSLNNGGKEIPLSITLETETDEKISEQLIYQMIMGQLRYLGTATKLNLAQAASALARFNSCPT